LLSASVNKDGRGTLSSTVWSATLRGAVETRRKEHDAAGPDLMALLQHVEMTGSHNTAAPGHGGWEADSKLCNRGCSQELLTQSL